MDTETDSGPPQYDILKTDCQVDANGTSCGPTGPGSQIPGLSAAGDGPEEKSRSGRRVGVLDSDSVYVKLAKQGGQKDLLSHGGETNLETKPNSQYQPPDWFAAGSDGHHEQPSPTDSDKAQRSLDAPFGGDNKSTWEREADRQKKVGNTASSQLEKLSLTGEDKQDGSKFKKTSHNKKADSVSMSKLLGFGYVQDGKETSN